MLAEWHSVEPIAELNVGAGRVGSRAADERRINARMFVDLSHMLIAIALINVMLSQQYRLLAGTAGGG